MFGQKMLVYNYLGDSKIKYSIQYMSYVQRVGVSNGHDLNNDKLNSNVQGCFTSRITSEGQGVQTQHIYYAIVRAFGCCI